jgi:hypothetical protein
MTEMVTLNAAREAQQYALLAQRSDVAPREQPQQPAIQISQAAVHADGRRGPQQAEAGAQDNAQQDLAQRRGRQDQGLTGPSRARVEIREFAPPAPKPAAPTPNLVADAAPLPVGGAATPVNSLATSPILNGQTQAQVEVAIAQQAIQTAAFENGASLDAAARNARLEAAARAVRAQAAVPVFTTGSFGEVELKKFADNAAALPTFGSGEKPVAEKYYGKGSEAVVGQFAAPEQPQKYADKAATTETGKSFEAGSGEAKYYDKVAQTETDTAGGDPQGQQKSMYDRAQEAVAGLGAPSNSASEGKPVSVTVTA